MDDIYAGLTGIFKKRPEVLFGVSGIGFSDFKKDYQCALVFAVPHTELLCVDNYDEQRFKDLIAETRGALSSLTAELTAFLDQNGVKYCPAPPQMNPETFESPFSLKFACVNAGLGWIGKNSLLVTEKYGPRVRPAAILIDYPLPLGTPVEKSHCPAGCLRCADTCPNETLSGKLWDIGAKRGEIIDFRKCEEGRLRPDGSRFACGLCMVSCPIGL